MTSVKELHRPGAVTLAVRDRLSPATVVAFFIAGQIVVWTLAPGLTRYSPPPDVLEGYMWGREWVIATYKHPALPSWVLEASRIVTGVAGWPAYLVSQLFIAATFVFVFLLGRDLLGCERAAAGTLLLAGVTFYGWHSAMFNHNVAQTPFWAALPWALWRAVDRQSVSYWALAGAVAAAGIYAKLWMALLLITLAAWILWDQRARRSLATLGPWVGLTAFVALTAPLAVWFHANNLAPVDYAVARPGGGPHAFLINMALNVAGLFAILGIARLLPPLRARGPDVFVSPLSDRARRFLLLNVTGPLVLAMVLASSVGFNLRFTWGTPMFALLGLAAVSLIPNRRFDRAGLQRVGACAVAVLIVAPLVYASSIRFGPPAGGPFRGAHWPQSEISLRMSDIWWRETGRPLRIVAGDSWSAGIVGATARDRPSVFTDGSFELAPWITQRRVDDEGMLVVWQDGKLPPRLQPLRATDRVGKEVFGLPGRSESTLAINYIVVPPKMPPQ
jgi:4-amino-4-deoxy-L-arabinose transferase-like glycosyltransferase